MQHGTLAKYLTQKDNLWYNQKGLYTGIIFLADKNSQIEPYEAMNGKIIKKCISCSQRIQSEYLTN